MEKHRIQKASEFYENYDSANKVPKRVAGCH